MFPDGCGKMVSAASIRVRLQSKSWNGLLITSNIGGAARGMLENMVLGAEKLLNLAGRSIELEPLLVGRDADVAEIVLLKPAFDRFDTLLGRCKDLRNLFR